MLVAIPLLALLLLFLLLHEPSRDWRNTLLTAAPIWGFILVASTEILSLFNALTFPGILTVWGIADAIFLAMCYRAVQVRGKLGLGKRPHIALPRWQVFSIGSIMLMMLIIALLSPPNTNDSLHYHMGRVAHWMQNGSVAHYPTNITRQVYLNPGAEFVLTHFQILSGGDHAANLAQWLSMAGSMAGISLLAKQLGAKPRGQMFAVVFALTLPMGILQSSSTQNDYVVAFWLVCLMHGTLSVVQDRLNWRNMVMIAAGLGLAVLTKGTAYVYAFPVMIWFGLVLVSRFHGQFWRQEVWGTLIIIGITVLAFNLGHYIRNYTMYGNLLGESARYSNEAHSLSTLISNSLRGLSLQVASPSEPINEVVEAVVVEVHNLLGLDVNDPKITFNNLPYHVTSAYRALHEDNAGAPFHLLFALLGIGFLLGNKTLRRKPFLREYLLIIIGCFLLYGLLFKWQPWQTRLYLPLFVLIAPLVGVVCAAILRRRVTNAIVILLLATSLLWVFFGRPRSLVYILHLNRSDQYFTNVIGAKQVYAEMARLIQQHGCTDVGLSVVEVSWEYLFWVTLQPPDGQPLRLEHVNVRNDSRLFPRPNFEPCAIIVSSTADVQHPDFDNMSEIILSDGEFVQIWTGGWAGEDLMLFVTP